MKTIQIAPDLTLPLDTVVQRKAIIAKNRAGKSNTGCVYVEEVHKHGVQTIVLDPKGDWYGIRSSADGKGPGLAFTIIGGDRGDLPLDAGSGKAWGEYLGANHIDAVLDVSEFSKGELAKFGADFLEALYLARKANRVPLNLVLEEADDFAPQVIEKWAGPDLPRCLGAVIKIAKKAGFLGIGLLLITQRCASLNKNVLSQADLVMFMRTTAPGDLKAADAWLQNQDDEKRAEVLGNIQGLPTGAAYVWAPEHGIFQKVQLRRRHTFDAGFTPKVGETRTEPKVLASVDLERLKTQMAATVEKARADDPKALRVEISRLQGQLAKREPTVEVKEITVEKRIPVVPVGFQRSLEGIAKQMADLAAVAPQNGEWGLHEVVDPRRIPPIHVSPGKAVIQGVEVPLQAAPREAKGSTGGLNGGARRMLVVLAQWPGRPFDRETLGILGDMKAGTGGFNNALSFLRNHDPPLIQDLGQGVVATAAGKKAVSPTPPKPTAADVREAWRGKFTGGARRMFEALERTYPNRMGRQDLADAAQMAYGTGGFNNALSDVRTKHLLDEDRDGIRLNPTLFLDGI